VWNSQSTITSSSSFSDSSIRTPSLELNAPERVNLCPWVTSVKMTVSDLRLKVRVTFSLDIRSDPMLPFRPGNLTLLRNGCIEFRSC
jgi:hypothetical protein